jgi:formamidopyrimidine-DNA glycosylase
MPELPEIVNLARQMNAKLEGKRIGRVELAQPKCLNLPPERFRRRIIKKRIGSTRAYGKWLFIRLEPGENLLLNLGMGGDLRYHKSSKTIPKKCQFRVTFNDSTELTASFWWFGYVHLASDSDLPKHAMTSKLGVSPIDEDFTVEKLGSLLSGRRGAIKSFLLDQKNVAGIGNVYVQDILFGARLHPLRDIKKLKPGDVQALHRSIRDVLSRSIKLGGLKYERDLYGRNGRFGSGHFMVGYKTGEPCPVCRTKVKKVRTGSTASYICPKCQRR